MVQRFLDCHVGLMHGSRRRLLAAVVAAVMRGHWIGVTRLGRGLAQSTSVKSAIKRVDRLIGSDRIAQEAQQVGAALLACLSRVVTDAGFRRPWFTQVERLGWSWVGRIRPGVLLSGDGCNWTPVASWYAQATAQARRMETCWLSKAGAMPCAAVLYHRRRRGRKQRGAQGRPTSHKAAREARTRETEPWLLVHSPRLTGYRPDEIVSFYARRMQIEESFRDSKSPAFGMGFRIGRSRSAGRLHALLLIATLAAFMLWHIGQLAEAEGLQRRYKLTTRATREISIITLALLLCKETGPPLTPIATQTLCRRLRL
jgi:hypothetical protein